MNRIELRNLIQQQIKILEARKKSNKLVIVDVQPAHKKAINFNVEELLEFATNYNDILVLYNGPELGYENSDKIRSWYESFVDYDTWQKLKSKMSFYEKNYGWFRSMMDSGIYMDDIISVVRYMIKNDIRDSRDIENLNHATSSEEAIDFLEFDDIYIPELEDELPSWKGADIVGGGKNECLKEVEILAEAMNIKLNLIKEFTY